MSFQDQQIATLQRQITDLRQSRGYSSGYSHSGPRTTPHLGSSRSSRSLNTNKLAMQTNASPLRSSASAYFSSNRTRNGYGEMTSQLCVSEVGSQQNLADKHLYVEAAHKAQQEQKLVRSAKSLDIMNGATLMTEYVVPNAKIYKNQYPETRKKLQAFARQKLSTHPTPRELKAAAGNAFDTDVHFHPPPEVFMRPNTQCGCIVEERKWNQRELQYNRSKAAQTEVHNTLTGNFQPSAKALLLPVGASHQQVLGIDNKLVGADPLKNAPHVDPSLKWYGDTVGWGGHNGLKSKEAKARFDESVNAICKGDTVLMGKYQGNQIVEPKYQRPGSRLSTASSTCSLHSSVSSTRPW